MKRSDLHSRMILSTVDYWEFHAWERLAERYPPKLVLAAIQREVDVGRLEYGVSARRPWLTEKGRAALLGESDTPEGRT